MATKAKQQVGKLDLRKQYRSLYAPSSKRVEVVDVPELLYLAIDGEIEPGKGPSDSQEFEQTMGAMYAVAYGLKFMSKLREHNPIDYTVMAVEGLWSIEPGTGEFDPERLTGYTLLMLQPEHITREMFDIAVSEANERRPNPALVRMRLDRWREGLCIQIMHIGPYADEPATLQMMRDFAAEHGYRLRGRHHEIYLGDPRRAKPENLKTILRQPVTT